MSTRIPMYYGYGGKYNIINFSAYWKQLEQLYTNENNNQNEDDSNMNDIQIENSIGINSEWNDSIADAPMTNNQQLAIATSDTVTQVATDMTTSYSLNSAFNNKNAVKEEEATVGVNVDMKLFEFESIESTLLQCMGMNLATLVHEIVQRAQLDQVDSQTSIKHEQIIQRTKARTQPSDSSDFLQSIPHRSHDVIPIEEPSTQSLQFQSQSQSRLYAAEASEWGFQSSATQQSIPMFNSQFHIPFNPAEQLNITSINNGELLGPHRNQSPDLSVCPPVNSSVMVQISSTCCPFLSVTNHHRFSFYSHTNHDRHRIMQAQSMLPMRLQVAAA